MDNWRNVQNLFEHIKLISEEAAHILREAVPYGPDILTLTKEDLNELLPGECNFQHRRDIMGLINIISQFDCVNKLFPLLQLIQDGEYFTETLQKIRKFFLRMPSLTTISSVKVHVLITEQTFNIHLIFMEKLKLQIEQCSAENCSVILVFCPVVSQVGTDMEAAMARITVNKPVILVFMHHCHSPSHMTNITVQPCRSNIVQVVHCAFHETKGLLLCQENEQAVAKVEATLKKYK